MFLEDWDGPEKCSGSTAVATWGELTAGEAEAQLVAADVFAAGWWFGEGRLVDGCHLVKRVAVCRSAGRLRVLMCCACFSGK